MSGQIDVYDEIEIEDLDFDAEVEMFFYPCPCGDKFQISLSDIKNGNKIAKCPSCSLTIRVIYD
jgi:diphthamide biosynthesis protein 3